MGIFEWNTVSNTFVQFFSNITGYVSVAPGDDEVLVVGYDSNVNVLKPQGGPQGPFSEGPVVVVHLVREDAISGHGIAVGIRLQHHQLHIGC